MLEILGVLAAGAATLATPCVLPLLPIYLAMLMGGSVSAMQDRSARGRLLTVTAAFSLGFTLVFTLLGLGASSVAQGLAAYRNALAVAGAGLIVLLGLQFLGWLRVPGLERDVRLGTPRRVDSVGGGLVFGVVFALGWTPCAGPVLAAVLSYAALSGSVARGAGLLAVYGLGMALPLLLVAAFADRAVPWLRRVLHRMESLQRVTGGVMLALGLWLGVSAAQDWQQSGTPAVTALTQDGTLLTPLLGAPLPRPRLVELVEDGCAVCRRMASQVDELHRDCTQHLVDVTVVSLSRPENAALRATLNVRAVPTVLLVDDQGALRGTLVGERSLEELRGLAASLQDSSCAGVQPVDTGELPQGAECPSGESRGDGQCG